MLDYKDILTKRYVLHMSLRKIAEETGAGKSGIHDFLNAKVWIFLFLPALQMKGSHRKYTGRFLDKAAETKAMSILIMLRYSA